jgi:flagellar biosynthesis/type III secretory pathway protein FliH
VEAFWALPLRKRPRLSDEGIGRLMTRKINELVREGMAEAYEIGFDEGLQAGSENTEADESEDTENTEGNEKVRQR